MSELTNRLKIAKLPKTGKYHVYVGRTGRSLCTRHWNFGGEFLDRVEDLPAEGVCSNCRIATAKRFRGQKKTRLEKKTASSVENNAKRLVGNAKLSEIKQKYQLDDDYDL